MKYTENTKHNSLRGYSYKTTNQLAIIEENLWFIVL